MSICNSCIEIVDFFIREAKHATDITPPTSSFNGKLQFQHFALLSGFRGYGVTIECYQQKFTIVWPKYNKLFLNKREKKRKKNWNKNSGTLMIVQYNILMPFSTIDRQTEYYNPQLQRSWFCDYIVGITRISDSFSNS